MDYDIIILGHDTFPHANKIHEANPNRTIYQYRNNKQGDKELLWRNCDNNIRDWAITRLNRTNSDYFLFLEYDVWADGYNFDKLVRLPIEQGKDFVSCYYAGEHWAYEEVDKLPSSMRINAVVAHPLAILLLSRKFLTELIKPRYDYLFNEDIFCELRMGTFAAFTTMNTGVFQANQIGRVSALRGRYPVYGEICHPVKTRN